MASAFILLITSVPVLPVYAASDEDFAPGGTATDHSNERFTKLKIIMDLKAESPASLGFGATVASRIMDHPGAKLIVVIEGPAINVFAKKNYLDHQGIVDSWVDLTKKGVRVEYCGNSVRGAGLKPSEMTGLNEKNPAIVNVGAFPTLGHYEAQGYAPVVTSLLEQQKN